MGPGEAEIEGTAGGGIVPEEGQKPLCLKLVGFDFTNVFKDLTTKIKRSPKTEESQTRETQHLGRTDTYTREPSTTLALGHLSA